MKLIIIQLRDNIEHLIYNWQQLTNKKLCY